MESSPATQASVASKMFHVESNDSRGELIDRAGIPANVVQHISEVMGALGRLREAEKQLSVASQRYMKLNETDMRALHFLMVCENSEVIATPGSISTHLGISAASTTKLLDRLESAGHIVRHSHPTDRRALAITVTTHTRKSAMETVGKQQARRFYAAARLTAEERDVVIRFLDDMSAELTAGGALVAQTPGSAKGS
jgi:DNA-binding MarR family transcriptional regulator